MRGTKLLATAGGVALLARVVLPRMALRALSADNTGLLAGPDQPVLVIRRS